MGSHRTERAERRAGARKALVAARPVVDPTPVPRDRIVLDDRKNPIPRKRPNNASREPRVDPTRVSGPIRVVLEPMLWTAFVSGVVWLLIALDPGVRTPAPGVVVYQHAFPLAILLGALLVISTVTALMWLPTSTTATRARTSFAGLGMLGSGWLFAKLHPVDSADFLGMSWLSIAVGVLLVTVCSVPWPTAAAHPVVRRSPLVWAGVAVLAIAIAAVSWSALGAARGGLVGSVDGGGAGWDELRPLLGLLALLLAGIRLTLRLPARAHAG